MKTAFLFPGQGAQKVGMGRELYEQVPEAKALFDRADAILGFELSRICFEGPEDALNATDVSQPAIYVASLAALEAFKKTDPETVASCQAAAGLSLGEYTALAFAGVFDFESGLKLVRRRGEAMQAASEASPGGMISVLGLEVEKLDALVERVEAAGPGRLWKANLLCPGNVAFSGDLEAIGRVEAIATDLGAMKAVPLAVAGAFHTERMKPADETLLRALEAVDLQPPRIPVYANVTAEPHPADSAAIRQSLANQVTNPVRWEDCMRRMIADGFDNFFEIGPGRVLTGLMKRIDRKRPCASVPAR